MLRQAFTAESRNPKLIQQLPKVIETTQTIPTSAGNDMIPLTITRLQDTDDAISPVIVHLFLPSNDNLPSSADLTCDLMQWFWDHYIDEKDRQQITVSPLRATLDDFDGLPSALLITCESDILLDEGEEEHAPNLSTAGVDVSGVVY
ncbi:hypothetical protein BJV82DRAFT_662283 [Fennellomyces sp. T-0311]|nr:hypothetical protein BJV82DRAFT_662283 [Fennellomyces sp. T-0311]